MPMRRSASSSWLVRIVTAKTTGASTPAGAAARLASTARAIIASPPSAWTVRNPTPNRAAAADAPATVFGMS
jgi:hypothetical protein